MHIDEWLKSGRYLPPPLRDFHDQKKVFQVIGEMVSRRKKREANALDNMVAGLPNWIMGQVYVIDFFLWFMARRGWTLQRSRQRLEFANLDDDIKAFEQREIEAFKAMLEESRKANA